MSKDKKDHLIISSPIEDIMGDRFGKYSKYIIQDRALPDARDGLKPVQRRILYAMYKDGNVFDKPHRKSAKTVGLVIGNYHPHGDTSVYEAMVRLSQQWKVNHTLIDMHGNNGSIDDDPAAAMRYTEARLAKIADALLSDIEQQTVAFAPNFDDTEMEPVVLPARYPNLLVNGVTGIAAGYATNMPPHNLSEVIDATIYRLQFPNCGLDELMGIVKGPDFPTGGIVQGKEGIREAFTTGRGRIVIRSKTEFVETKTIRQLVITEIPYEVIKVNIVKKIDEIRINKDLDGLLDVRDESDRNGLKIVVDMKKDADQNLILNYLLKNTDLQVYYNYNNIAIVDKRPVQLGLAQLIDAYIVHREEIVLNRSKYQYQKMDTRCHILEGLMKAISIVDEVIAIIRASKDKADSKQRLMEAFLFTEVQAEAIVTLRLYRLTSTDITDLRKEFALLVSQMEELKSVIQNNAILRQVIIKELKEIKEEFGRERLTQIQDQVEEIVIDKISMITNERVMVTVSKDGYVKRVSLRSYQASGETILPGLKEGDQLVGTVEADTLDTLLAFTDQGNYIFLPVYQIEEAKWKELGNHLTNYVKYNNNQKIVNAVLVKNFETNAWITTMTKNGMIKRSPVAEYFVQRNNKAMANMNLKGDDVVTNVFVTYFEDDYVILTQQGYMIRYNSELITPTGTKSQGVKAIRLAQGDIVVGADTIRSNDVGVVVVSTKGQMKRLRKEEIEFFNRATKGELILKKAKKNPAELSYVKSVQTYESLFFCDKEAVEVIAKDITIMTKDATLSSPISLEEPWYLIPTIEEVSIEDFKEPNNQQENEEVFEAVDDEIDELTEDKYEFMGLDLK